jgi:hypothetical protein
MSQGPLRIIRWPKAYGTDASVKDKVEDGIKDYFVKLASIAPTAVTGFYLTFRPMVIGNLTAEQVRADWLAGWYPWICVGLAIVVKTWETHQGEWWRGQWKAVAISTVAFMLWVISMGHYMAIIGDWAWLKDPRFATLLVGVFTFVITIFVKGDPPAKPQGEG